MSSVFVEMELSLVYNSIRIFGGFSLMKIILSIKAPYKKHVDIATLFFSVIISAVCIATAIFFLLQQKETTYYYTYLSACFPTGELTSSIILLISMFILGMIASSPVNLGAFNKYLYIIDAVIKLFASVYFTVFLRNIPQVIFTIVVTAVYVALSVVSAITVDDLSQAELQD